MGWRDHLLRLLARGRLAPPGERFESEAIVRLIERIEADQELSGRLDALSEDELLDAIRDLIAGGPDSTD